MPLINSILHHRRVLFFPSQNAFKRALFIQTEQTPNENALKFKPGHEFGLPAGKTFDFSSRKESIKSPLASRIFQLEGIEGVMIANDFVTVLKSDMHEWKHLKPHVYEIITNFVSNQLKPINEDVCNNDKQINDEKKRQNVTEEDKATFAMINELIDSRIRPAIQEDGGDVELVGYVDGIVKLKLQGACKSCSSSVVTLKNGIERMLMHYLPEVKGVEQVLEEYVSEGIKEFERLEEDLQKRK